MATTYKNGVDIIGSVLPWKYLSSGVAVAAALLLSKRLLQSPTHKDGVPLPPGPPAAWFWQNPMPMKHIAHDLTALIEQFGPVISLRQGSDVTIVIGRMDAATEIMEKEGGALVDRPRMIAAAEIFSSGTRLLLASGGERFRRLRRAAHTHLQLKVAQTYEEIQAEAAKNVIIDILNDPERHIMHAQRYAVQVILRVTYGKTSPTSSDDPEMVRIRQAAVNSDIALRPGVYLVDRIPWLKYLPGYGRQLKAFRQYELSLYRDQLDRVRRDMAANRAGNSFGKMLLEHIDDHQLSETEVVYLAGDLSGAATDTTSAGITVMVIAAACHPDAQIRVQEELNEVVGNERLPTFEDWDALPQLQAFVLEAMRWRPVVPNGIAHRATKDIIWRNQCIPAGATVLGCHWAISRDPKVFPDPETFNPQRWLTEEGRLRTDMHFYTYGFGRRVCPGQHVAMRSLYINLAYLLWSFRITRRPGAMIDLGPDGFTGTIVLRAKPFEVDFVPRIDEGRLRELMA